MTNRRLPGRPIGWSGWRAPRLVQRCPHQRHARGGFQTPQGRCHLRGNGVSLLSFRARDYGRPRGLYRDGVLPLRQSQDDTASGVVSSEEPMAGSPSRTSERHVRRSRQPARAGPAACACQSTACACRVDSLHVPVDSVSTACACRAGSLRMPACSLITSNHSTSPLCR